MSPVLLRPKRPLPRRFNRSVSPATRQFVKRRHQKAKELRRHQWRVYGRRFVTLIASWKKVVRQWALLLGTGVVALLVGIALFSPLFDVREISVQRGEGRVDVPRIQKALAPFFGRHMLYIGNNEVADAVKAVVPDVDRVSVEKQYPSRLFISIALKPIAARIILEEPKKPAVTGTGTGAVKAGSGAAAAPAPAVKKFDYVTDNGIYISTPSAQLGTALPTIRIVDWAVRPVPDTPLLTQDFLQRVRRAEQILTDQFGQKITDRTVYLRGQEFHLTAGKISLWFDMESSLDEQLSRFRIFLQTIGLSKATQYVDLRLEGRIVYR
jgi:hypothetical protein